MPGKWRNCFESELNRLKSLFFEGSSDTPLAVTEELGLGCLHAAAP